MENWLRNNPQVRTIRVATSDLNGQARGKRLPARFADKALNGGLRFPMSVLNLDILGRDIHDSPLVYETGDRDAPLRPTERGFVPMPWLETPTALLPIWMFEENGNPFSGDPRHALAAILDRYSAKGLRPVCAVELEFFLIDDSGDSFQVPASPRSGKRRIGDEILSISALDRFDAFFTDLYEGCDAMDIPADAAISESGLGQFEINLMHSDNALKAADDAWLFKLLTKGLARRHGFAASFMAKPYPDYAGSGLHVHFSVLDDAGHNIFDDGGDAGTDTLRHAVAGCLRAMPASTLVFAPHANSFDRMVPGSHAPTGVSWAYENRTSAIRIPGGKPSARRIEHRVAGGDVNPYLMLSAILGAALDGIEDRIEPPAAISGNAYDAELPQIPGDWNAAIAAFESSADVARIFPADLIRNFVLTKKQESRDMSKLPIDEQRDIYLDTV